MLKHKKFLTAMMIFIIATLVASGCSESDKSVAPVSNTYHEFTDENGKTHSYDTADPDFIAAKAQSEALEKWVERMDPYVTENKDGTYEFDYTSFEATYGELDGINKTTVKQLKNGIPIVNQKILEQRRSSQPVAAGFWAQWHWWGYKYCYSEYTAVVMLDWMSRSGYAYPLFYWANYNYYRYGRFCMNHTWAGGVWITNS